MMGKGKNCKPVLIQQKFKPACPQCKIEMPLVKGQKDGAWRCKKCSWEFWDKIDKTIPEINDEIIGLDLNLVAPTCHRCNRIMIHFQEEAWYCPQCLSQFHQKGAPDVNKITDQLIHSTTKDLIRPEGGFKMLMSAKKKSSGRRSGRRRKKKIPCKPNYYFPDSNKGA